MRKNKFSFRKEAAKITAIYILFGVFWIFASDLLVKSFVSNGDTVFKLNVVKGLSYVIITGGLIYFLTARHIRKIACALELLQNEILVRTERECEIVRLNKIDSLTGLHNRKFFEEEKLRLDVQTNLPLSVIFADVNGLKLLNDGFGHAEGDSMLIATANLIKQHCRDKDSIARIGGDEFCILLPNTEIDIAENIIAEIQEACEESPIKIADSLLKLSVSFGTAVKRIPTEKLTDIIKAADDEMRKNKLLRRKSTRSELVEFIKTAMLERSHETVEHASRMASLCKEIGVELNFMDSLLFELELAASLHDIGESSLDYHLLNKTGCLSEEDWGEIKKHPEAGYRIAQIATELVPIAEYILTHHERWDGKGYPQGLVGEDIPLVSRIIAIVDAYDAMTTGRSYKLPMRKQEALSEILKNAGTQFDPYLAKLFVEKIMDKNRITP